MNLHHTRAASIAVIMSLALLIPVGAFMLVMSDRDQIMRTDRLEDRVTLLKDRVVDDELAFCRVLTLSLDSEQSWQLSMLARSTGDKTIERSAAESASLRRIPEQCKP